MVDRDWATYYDSVVRMPTSVRLNPETERLLQRLVLRSGRSKSDVIRRAIEVLAEQAESGLEMKPVFERVEHLLGVATGGDPTLSKQTGRRFTEQLRQRRKSSS